MKLKKKGQISTEYLILLSFVTFLVLTALGVAFFYAGGIRDSLRSSQIESFSDKITSLAEEVYYSGAPSTTTMKGYLPSGIEGIEISEKDIIFNVTTEGGTSVIAYSANVNMTGTISPTSGVKKIQLTARDNNVLITEG
jgi:uncharacterized protein (UPF0333 family)